MNLLNYIQKSIQNVSEKNHRHAQKNRIRLVMKKEADVLNKAYLELGKYYYENLRSLEPGHPAALCDTIEHSKVRLLELKERLVAVDAPAQEEEASILVEEDYEDTECDAPVSEFFAPEEPEEVLLEEEDSIRMNSMDSPASTSYLDAEKEAADEEEVVIPLLEESPAEELE